MRNLAIAIPSGTAQVETRRLLAEFSTHAALRSLAPLRNAAMLAGTALLLLYIAVKVLRTILRVTPAGSELKPHYLRLGQIAPSDICHCDAGQHAGRAYHDCCRSRDIEKLEADVGAFNWHAWTKKSYAGRRWTRSMKSRLEEYPLPPVVLPEWVTTPEKHTFPVPEEMLRTWRPPGMEGESQEIDKHDDPVGLGF